MPVSPPSGPPSKSQMPRSVSSVGTAPWTAGTSTSVESDAGREATTITAARTAIAATRPIAPSRRLRVARRCRRSCWFQASRSGSTFCETIAKTSLSSGMRASRGASEDGTPLRREGPHGRRADAHDPCGFLGAVAVHVEQEDGGALSRRQVEQQAPDVLAELDLVERVAIPSDGDKALTGPACRACAHPEPVQRDPEEVGGRIVDPIDPIPPFPEFQEGVLHQLGGVGPVPRHEVQSLEEPPVLLGEERREVERYRGPSGEPDDVALCLHRLRRCRRAAWRLG